MKIKYFLAISFTIITFASCLRDDASIYLSSINFNEDHKILSINYNSNPDTAIHQIIYKSGVRKKGYGLLLNVDQSASSDELKKLTYQFQLQDINAVHSFDINSGETPNHNVIVALEQARFIWIFSNNMYNLSGNECQPVIQAVKQATNSGAILVIDEKYREKLSECLELH